MNEQSALKKKPMSPELIEKFYATGRRKEAVARVWVFKGSGKIIVNGKELSQYFVRPVLRMIINQPFAATEMVGQYDVQCTVEGSGLSGQAGAIRLGISRALNTLAPEMHGILKQRKFLTRDGRTVERKMYGHKKSRKSFQFSKR